jgi:hypothetical protein
MIIDNKKDFLWTSIPTWAGTLLETGDFRFRGIYYDNSDYSVHIAAMQAGRHGEWSYQFRFTTEPHEPAYFKLFYIVLGHFSKWFQLAPEFTYHFARWILGFTALLALYRLMRQVFSDLVWARTAFLLAALGSGLGWLQASFGWTSTQITPIDFWLIDDYVFFSLSVFPHFAFVTAAMCITVSLWLDFLEKARWINIPLIGLIAVLVQFVNPIAFATVDISLVGATLFSWWNAKRIRKEDIGALFVIAIAQIPMLAYNFMVLNSDPLWSQFTAQNQTLSPPPDYYIWGFAFFWPFVIYGMIIAFRTKSNALGAAVLWTISGFLLAYAPVYIQRRFLQNITIPLAILATAGLIKLFETVATRNPGVLRWRFHLVTLFIFLTSISSIQIGVSQIAYIQTHPKSLYYPASLDPGINWFQENAQYNDFVLASEPTSQILAQKTGLRAYFGHEMETLHFWTKRTNVELFFQGNLPELANAPVKWVVYGPFERELSPNFPKMDNLELVFETQELQIYQVK